MKRILCLYSSRYGQTARISQYIARILSSANYMVDISSADKPLPEQVMAYDAILLGSSIYRGQHNRKLARWARSVKNQTENIPTGLFLVSLNAADARTEARFAENKLMNDWVSATGWRPQWKANFIGALNYLEYGLLTRWMLRRISKAAGGPTDMDRDHELTDWQAVDAFARRVLMDLQNPIRTDVSSAALQTHPL